jgi:cell division protein FtsW (lipid II flippase)
MLVLFTVTLPLLVVAYVNDSGMAVVVTVVTTSIFWTSNEVAR